MLYRVETHPAKAPCSVVAEEMGDKAMCSFMKSDSDDFPRCSLRHPRRFGVRGVSWQGNDENDPASGRGWVVLGTAGRLVGHFYIHNGEGAGSYAIVPDFFNGLLVRRLEALTQQSSRFIHSLALRAVPGRR